jgi:hypothetical protein
MDLSRTFAYNIIQYVFKYLFFKIYQHIDFCMFAENM